MFEAVRIARARRGDDLPAAYIQGITGMAFRIAGPCPCAPTCSAGMSPDELIELLGYECEHLDLGEREDEFENPVADVVERVKTEIRAGRPVPVWHAFTNAEWDLVCGFDDETQEFLGVGSYGAKPGEYARAPQTRMKQAVAICPAYGALIIGKKTGRFDARPAELDALEEAVRHAHAPADPFLVHRADAKIPWRFREGLACYDGWAHRFRAVPDAVPDGPGDRYPFGVYSHGRQAAPEFLKQIAPGYPPAEEHLLAAAEHFTADAATLRTIRDELLGWGAKWDKPDREKAARTVELLMQARRSYAEGMQSLERALEAIDPQRAEQAKHRAVVDRGPDSALIRDVRPLQWATGRDCTFIGALHEALRNTSSFYTYSDLMGLCGLAFRFRYANAETKTQWCPSCAVGEMPDEQKLLPEQIGWSLPTEYVEPEGRDNEALAARIAAQIDAGRAVVAYPDGWNMALVYGYEDGGKTLIVNDYMDKEPPRQEHMSVRKSAKLPVEKMGPLVTFLGECGTAPPPREALRRALQVAISNHKRGKHDGGIQGREYWYGRAALTAWIGDLRNFEALKPEDQRSLLGLDPWVYTQLWDARKATAQFLTDWACTVEGQANEALLDAAELYREEAEILEPLLASKREAPGETAPDTAQEPPVQWPADDRNREVEVLTEALEFEDKAVVHLERALDSLSAE